MSDLGHERVDHMQLEPISEPPKEDTSPNPTDPPQGEAPGSESNDDSDPNLAAAKAAAEAANPTDPPAEAGGEDPQPVPYTPPTLEALFDATLSEEGIPDEMGLHVIDTLTRTFGEADHSRATEMVQTYMEGREAIQKLSRLEMITEALPSYERYGEVMEFGKKDEAARNEYNKALSEAKTQADLTAALRTLNSRFEAYHGSPPSDPVHNTGPGGQPPAPTVQPITSRTEYLRLVGDQRYDTDATWREGVEVRLRASINAGVYKADA